MVEMSEFNITPSIMLEKLGRFLSAYTPKDIVASKDIEREASVLVPIILSDDELSLLFTKRTEDVLHHKGQISFPGGGVEKDDKDIICTALREAEEEIGLDPRDVEVLGRIDDVVALVSGYLIHPIVGVVRELKVLTLNPKEVAEVFLVPLKEFLKYGQAPPMLDVQYNGTTIKTQGYPVRGHIIWGATARIIKTFVGIVSSLI